MGVGHDAGLIVVFAVGAYGFGSLLRGSELIVNEVAIVRGAPGTTDGTAQVYLGVFSPSRGTYQVRVPGGALLSAPISGDFFGGDGTTASLDVLQGDPARVRDLGVGLRFAADRPGRDAPSTVPLVEADLRLENGRLKGTVTQRLRPRRCSSPRSSWAGRSPPSRTWPPARAPTVDVAVQNGQFGQQLSDKIVGPVFFGDPRQQGEDTARLYARHTIIDQLTYDPNFGFTGQLPADGPVILAWADARPAARRDRGPDATAHRQHPVLPADRAGGLGHDHVPQRPAALHGRRLGRRLLQQGPVQHQLRPRQRADRVPAHRLRGPLRPRRSWPSA